jgi:hypothetical protein
MSPSNSARTGQGRSNSNGSGGTILAPPATIDQRIEECEKMVENQSHRQFAKLVAGPATMTVKQAKNSANSVCQKHGVRVHIVDPNNTDPKKRLQCFFICLSCASATDVGKSTREPIKITATSTGNATSHINERHGEKSERSVKMEANARQTQLAISNANPGFEKDSGRFFSHCFGMLAAHHGNSFVQYRSDLWNLIVHHIPDGGDALRNLDIRKPMVEAFLVTKRCIVEQFQLAKNSFY